MDPANRDLQRHNALWADVVFQFLQGSVAQQIEAAVIVNEIEADDQVNDANELVEVVNEQINEADLEIDEAIPQIDEYIDEFYLEADESIPDEADLEVDAHIVEADLEVDQQIDEAVLQIDEAIPQVDEHVYEDVILDHVILGAGNNVIEDNVYEGIMLVNEDAVPPVLPPRNVNNGVREQRKNLFTRLRRLLRRGQSQAPLQHVQPAEHNILMRALALASPCVTRRSVKIDCNNN